MTLSNWNIQRVNDNIINSEVCSNNIGYNIHEDCKESKNYNNKSDSSILQTHHNEENTILEYNLKFNNKKYYFYEPEGPFIKENEEYSIESSSIPSELRNENIRNKRYDDAVLFSTFLKEVNKFSEDQRVSRRKDNSFDSLYVMNRSGFCISRNIKGNQKQFLVNNYIKNKKYKISNPYQTVIYDQRAKSYEDLIRESARRQRLCMESSECLNEFICYYCDAKYVYKQCLLNHLAKTHRKAVMDKKL